KVKKSARGYFLTLKNTGGMPAPVNVILTYEDGSTDSIHETPAIWEKDLKQTEIEIPAKKQVRAISLDGGIFMDANPTDNDWQAK
ncbi:MAG: M1 family peptidase, partial [Bacteroidota bacterium]|nr:M1 family peptidase [Bacteroidota bacterium]